MDLIITTSYLSLGTKPASLLARKLQRLLSVWHTWKNMLSEGASIFLVLCYKQFVALNGSWVSSWASWCVWTFLEICHSFPIGENWVFPSVFYMTRPNDCLDFSVQGKKPKQSGYELPCKISCISCPWLLTSLVLDGLFSANNNTFSARVLYCLYSFSFPAITFSFPNWERY